MGLFSRIFRAKERPVVANSFEKMPIFHQTLCFPFPLAWPLEPLHRELEGGRFTVEFSAEGQSRESWREKLIVQGFNSANDDADMNARLLLKMMKEEMQGLDEKAFQYEELFSETKEGREKIAVLMGLDPLPDQAGVVQWGLYLIAEGEHDMYIVQRAWKAVPGKEALAIPREELAAWLEDFKKIELLDTAAAPQAE